VLTIRSRQPGEDFIPLGRPQKTLKKWMIDEKIPSRERNRVPVLAWGETVGGVLGLGVAEDCHPKPGEAAWHCQQTFSNNKKERE
jgi:tRNA(Ile)-lysidine synthase